MLNTRPRDFYDVYILTKIHQRMIDKDIFIAALNATAQKRISLAAPFASYLHGICGILIIVTFPIAASLFRSGLIHSQSWSGPRRPISFMTWLVWFGLLFFVGSTVILGVLSGPVSRTEATLLIGWQNRLMILTYALWPMIAVWPAISSTNKRD